MESISSKLYGAKVDPDLKWREEVGTPKDKMIRNKEKDRKKDRQNDPPRRAAIQIIRLTDYCHTS